MNEIRTYGVLLTTAEKLAKYKLLIDFEVYEMVSEIVRGFLRICIPGNEYYK